MILSQSEKKLLDSVKTLVLVHDLTPTIDQVIQSVDDLSRDACMTAIDALLEAGYLHYQSIADQTLALAQEDEWAVPLKGRIAAGQPLEVIAQPDLINLPELLAGQNRYMLEVKGDSMIGDQICDGDWVLCETSNRVHSHEIAVVLIDHEAATLKRLRHNTEQGTTDLIPSNPSLSPVTYATERLTIQGRYIGLIRMAQ